MQITTNTTNKMTYTPTYKIIKEITDVPVVNMNSPQACYDFIQQFYFEDRAVFESFFLVMVDRALNTAGYVKISQGGTAGTVVDIKIIAKYAIDSMAAGVVLAHNHPSGRVEPSESDIKLTKNVQSALLLFDIQVIDHIILSGTSDTFYSFANHCKL